MSAKFKEGLYIIWCGVNRLGDSGVHTLDDTSAFVNPTDQLLLTRRGKLRMDGVGIVFEFYITIIIIRQPLCPVVGRRPQHAVSKLPCFYIAPL